MSFFNTMNISASGLTAQRIRMDVISENLANINTTRATDGKPYKRRIVLFEERKDLSPFETMLNKAVSASLEPSAGKGVRASRIVEDTTPGNRVYEPEHPDADADGYVTMPNVNSVQEMVNMISASRSYEANVTSLNTTKAMLLKTLEISR